MANAKDDEKDRHDPRRRFLKDALKGSMSVLLGAAAGRIAAAGRVVTPGRGPDTRPPPPPAPAETVPDEAREALDRQQEEFDRDNPGQSRYPSA